MGVFACYTVSLTVRSPFMFQGLANSRLGIDAPLLRDELDRVVIPADQIRGVLRSACYRLQWDAPQIAPKRLFKALFGAASPENENSDPDQYDRPDRGALIAGDLVADAASKSLETTRIEIDDETGAAKSGALQIVELAAPFGKDVSFSGKFHLQATNDVDAIAVETLLARAIRLVPAIGAFKSAGFGEVITASVFLDGTPEPVVAAVGGSAPDRIAYRITFDRPFVVDAKRETDNLFVGETVVPGGALKGALAAKLAVVAGIDPKSDGWGEALAALRISHAFPENDEDEPKLSGFRVPHSLYCWKRDEQQKFDDALFQDDAEMERFVDENKVAPTHPIDWKGAFFTALRTNGLVPAPPTIDPQPRTHVRIDGEKLIPVEGALFTTVAQGVLRGGKPRAWRVVLDFRNVAEDRRAALCGLIKGRLHNVGRTGASVTFEPIDDQQIPDARDLGRVRLNRPPDPVPIDMNGKRFHAMTLVTPALLTDPRSTVSIEAQYEDYIVAQTGGQLVRSYTSRRLAGGYIATRYRPYGLSYYPFILTEPGSVFLVEGGDVEKLGEIARFGLPPIALSHAPALTWRSCPYLRENGYGEVVFSLVDPIRLRGGV